MKNIIRIFLFLIIIVINYSCKSEDKPFKYPNSKIWAHRVNDISEAQAKKELFAGLEVDLYYSEYQNEIFVAHDIEDTIHNLTFNKWLSVLDSHEKSWYWLDVKNLTEKNGSVIASKLLILAKEYKIKNKIIIESYESGGLKIVRDLGLSILFWVDNLNWWENKDTALWEQRVRRRIEDLNPNAISANQNMYPLLTNTFPEMPIHYWNTPIGNYEENIEKTKVLCSEPNVKVVLVDYDEPIEY